jgi:hypothetical protein
MEMSRTQNIQPPTAPNNIAKSREADALTNPERTHFNIAAELTRQQIAFAWEGELTQEVVFGVRVSLATLRQHLPIRPASVTMADSEDLRAMQEAFGVLEQQVEELRAAERVVRTVRWLARLEAEGYAGHEADMATVAKTILAREVADRMRQEDEEDDVRVAASSESESSQLGQDA